LAYYVPCFLINFHALRAYSQALRAEFNGVEAAPPDSCSLREH
jgi:hypothetical protein